MENLQVPVTNEDGETVLEDWNPAGKQSDGSQYFLPRKLVEDGHEHYFKKHPVNNRMVICECGHGGMVYPHNAKHIDGHVYTLDGRKVI